jgi:hypothetical protein
MEDDHTTLEDDIIMKGMNITKKVKHFEIRGTFSCSISPAFLNVAVIFPLKLQ